MTSVGGRDCLWEQALRSAALPRLRPRSHHINWTEQVHPVTSNVNSLCARALRVRHISYPTHKFWFFTRPDPRYTHYPWLTGSVELILKFQLTRESGDACECVKMHILILLNIHFVSCFNALTAIRSGWNLKFRGDAVCWNAHHVHCPLPSHTDETSQIRNKGTNTLLNKTPSAAHVVLPNVCISIWSNRSVPVLI